MTEQPAPTRYHYPVFTFSGIAYRAPVKVTRSCNFCRHRDECRPLVMEHDGFALCEAILPGEIITENYGGNNDIS